ncbi:MAG: hypothetical protein PHX22_11170 [Dysgonamonadaceae bacterium]|nr:hypothetical protein [Dysgonamonadaceae bacterium]
MQREIQGGTDVTSDCVATAIGLASSILGCSVDMNAVTETAVDLIMASNPSYTRAFAKGYYALNGLTEQQTSNLLSIVFTDIATGGCGSGESTIAFVKNNDGSAHAVVKKENPYGVIYYTDGTNNYFEGAFEHALPPVTVSYVSDGYYNSEYDEYGYE